MRSILYLIFKCKLIFVHSIFVRKCWRPMWYLMAWTAIIYHFYSHEKSLNLRIVLKLHLIQKFSLFLEFHFINLIKTFLKLVEFPKQNWSVFRLIHLIVFCQIQQLKPQVLMLKQSPRDVFYKRFTWHILVKRGLLLQILKL
jgi:hypothetical protein